MSKPIVHILLKEIVKNDELKLIQEKMAEILKEEYHVIVTAADLEIKIIK